MSCNEDELYERIANLEYDNEELRTVLQEVLNLLSDGPGGPLRISAIQLLCKTLGSTESRT